VHIGTWDDKLLHGTACESTVWTSSSGPASRVSRSPLTIPSVSLTARALLFAMKLNLPVL
jgi:hypothetical protein